MIHFYDYGFKVVGCGFKFSNSTSILSNSAVIKLVTGILKNQRVLIKSVQ